MKDENIDATGMSRGRSHSPLAWPLRNVCLSNLRSWEGWQAAFIDQLSLDSSQLSFEKS